MGLKRGSKKLTPEQIDAVIALKKSGIQNNKIAKRFQVPHWIIGYVLRENNLKSFHTLDKDDITKMIGLHSQGFNNTRIAIHLGVTDTAVGRALKRYNLTTNLRRIEDIGEEIIHCYRQGNCTTEIARVVGFSDANIGLFLRRRGLPPQKYQSIKLVDDKHAECSKCGHVKELLNWPVNRNRFLSYCGDCRNAQVSSTRNDNPFKVRFYHIRKRCYAAKIEYDISPEFLEQLWRSQRGLCFYTDRPMTREITANDPAATSVDRIIPGLAYTKDNVVLCQRRINTIKSNTSLDEMKEWMPNWYTRIMVFLSNNSGNS